ncbi:Pre-rRNA-processing protein TSR2 family protein [Babesia bovis T2Bo]|uniref:Pre-rRNA-processing protein TSR2 family protein n=1 Tax=Babesia bovis T2Bo TaxID=484906 RepID=UPI001C361894|nr:Pre-rRNA-processing protein TSR2 family protein [Babesia bovis T2Bo]KAG6440033.1 Pre-rRNA-processing protein TSR2 family protein [Babesia bovis T2Bo]
MADAVREFREAARCVMECWTALNLAVENNWGGDNSSGKKDELINLVIDFCLSKNDLYPYEVEDLLFERMQTMFCVDIEDESEVEVAALLARLHQSCKAGDIAYAHELRQNLTKCDNAQCKGRDNIQELSESEEDTESLDVSRIRQPKTELLEDGWTRVL